MLVTGVDVNGAFHGHLQLWYPHVPCDGITRHPQLMFQGRLCGILEDSGTRFKRFRNKCASHCRSYMDFLGRQLF
jgi:hypothetical protein